MRAKTLENLEAQYKRLLKQVFSKLKFQGIRWNWHEVYSHDPYTDPKFLRIHNAFVSTSEKRNHPFYKKEELVTQRLDDFDLPYTDEEVEKLINDYWDNTCSDDANVNEIVLQHQYNIS